MPAPTVILAEDDGAIRDLLAHHLAREGYALITVADGAAALRRARERGVDLLILDIGLPGIDGFEVARTLRREASAVPIVMLTARTDEVDRVVGLEIGADDYVCKPFSPREVVARAKAVLRRSGGAAATPSRVLRFGRLEIDEAAREARVDGGEMKLRPREFALLIELASNAGIALSRRRLLDRVWGFDFVGEDRTVDVHIRRLRVVLEESGNLPPIVQTIHGFGYKFLPP